MQRGLAQLPITNQFITGFFFTKNFRGWWLFLLKSQQESEFLHQDTRNLQRRKKKSPSTQKKSGMWFFLQSKPVFPKSSALFMPKLGLTLTPAPDDSAPEHPHPNISHIQYLKISPFLRIEAQSVLKKCRNH